MSSASVQWVFYRNSSTCRCISDVSVGRKVISTSYSSAIFSQSLDYWFIIKGYNSGTARWKRYMRQGMGKGSYFLLSL